MKVLVVGTGGALRGSGITTMADQLTRTLGKMGHEAVRLELGTRSRKCPNRLNVENVLALIGEMWTLLGRARSERPDVVWLHTIGVPLLPAVRMLLLVTAVRCAGRPAIIHLHAFDLAGQLRRVGARTAAVLRIAGRLSARVVVLHEADGEAITGVAPAADVRVLPNWVEVPSAATPLPVGPPWVVVFVGGLISRKGLPELLAAMRLIDDLPICLRVVGGPGDEGVQAAEGYRAAAADLVARGAVTFVGELDRAGVRSELQRAHLFVLPSKAEGTPMALLEAMAEGRPALVSGGGDMERIVREAGSLALAGNEPEALSSALKAALGDAEVLSRMGQSAWQAMARRGDAASVGARIAAILPMADGISTRS